MRHIEYDPSKLVIPKDWESNAQKLRQSLLAEPNTAAKAKIINSNQQVWKSVKASLAKISNYKCWYTDSPQIGTDVDVDHYRPKNRVGELKDHVPPHPGYWWLAFDLENYRYSCIVANRRRVDVDTNNTGGKADYFPLLDESKRAWDPTSDVEEEQPTLIDPCKASDVKLITFKDDGEAMPRVSKFDKPNAFRRAEVSIEYYHLNHTEFVRARQLLREEMRKLMKSAKRYYNKLETGDSTHAEAYERALQRLISMCDKSSPFSSFCKAYIENFKYEDYLDGVLF